MSIALKGFHEVNNSVWETYVNTDSTDDTITIVQENPVTGGNDVIVLELDDLVDILDVVKANMFQGGLLDSDGDFVLTSEGMINNG